MTVKRIRTIVTAPVASQGLSFKGGPALKISTRPTPEVAQMFTSLREALYATDQVKNFGKPSVAEVLVENGVEDAVVPLVESLVSKCHAWGEDLCSRIESQYSKYAREISDLQLPVYNPQDHASSTKEFFQKGSSLESIATAVSRVKSFVAAASTCCKLSGVSADTSAVSSKLGEGKTFMYVSTILTILTSTTWKTMTPELAKKGDTKCGQLCNNLLFSVKEAGNDGVSLPGELQSMISEKLTSAGLSL